MGERAEGFTKWEKRMPEAIQAWQQLVDSEDPVKLESEFGHMYAMFIVGTGYASNWRTRQSRRIPLSGSA